MTDDRSARANFAHYRDLLESYGFRPSRRLGQNFLLDPTLHRAIVEDAGVRPGDVVLEVGPGLGFLTRELAAAGADVLAVEIDSRLFEILEDERDSWGEAGKRVELLHASALAGSGWNPVVVEALAARAAGRPVRLVANLPYAAAGPLLATAGTLTTPPVSGAVMVQLDLAQRLIAGPGTPEYGAPTVMFSLTYQAKIVRRVGSDVFWPKPKVGSAVLGFEARLDTPFAAMVPSERAAFAGFVRALFGQRRKRLSNTLPAALEAVGRGIPPDLPSDWMGLRPGVLERDQFLRMWSGAPRLP